MMSSALPPRRSYFEDFLRSRSHSAGGARPMRLESDKLVTDRAAYISFLETQLERVTAACLAVDALEERLRASEAQNVQLNDKLVALTQLTQLTQSYTERQGQEAGTAVATLHAALQDTMARAEAQSAQMAAMAAHMARLEESGNLAQARVDALEQAQARAQEDSVATSNRVDAVASAVRAVEAASATRATVAQLTHALEGVDAKVDRAVARVTEAVQVADAARAGAQRAADTAIAAEASAIAASEAARSAASASVSASTDAQRATHAASDASRRAAAAGSTANAALRNVVAAAAGVPSAAVAGDDASPYMPTPLSSPGGPTVVTWPQPGAPIPTSSDAVGDALTRVLDIVLPHVNHLASRVSALDTDLARTRTSAADHSQAHARSLATAEADIHARISEVSTEMRGSLSRLSERVEEVGTAWTTWEAAFSDGHAQARDAAAAAARSRDAAEAAQREQDREAASREHAQLRASVDTCSSRLTALETAVLGEAPLHASAATGVVQARETAASPALGTRIASQVQTAVDAALEDINAELEALQTQQITNDTEHKQLVRATDSLVRRWTEAHEAITELQAQLADVREHTGAPTTAAFGGASAATPGMQPAGMASPAAASPGSSTVSHRDVLRIVDTIVQPRMQDIAAELHTRLTEEIAAATAQGSSPSRRRSPARSPAPHTRAHSSAAASPSADGMADVRGLETAFERAARSTLSLSSVAAAAPPVAALNATVPVDVRALIEDERRARADALSQMRVSVEGAERACRTVAADAVRTCTDIAHNTQTLIARVEGLIASSAAAAAVAPAPTAGVPPPAPVMGSSGTAEIALSNALTAMSSLLQQQQQAVRTEASPLAAAAAPQGVPLSARSQTSHTIGFVQRLMPAGSGSTPRDNDSVRGGAARTAPVRPLTRQQEDTHAHFRSPGELTLMPSSTPASVTDADSPESSTASLHAHRSAVSQARTQVPPAADSTNARRHERGAAHARVRPSHERDELLHVEAPAESGQPRRTSSHEHGERSLRDHIPPARTQHVVDAEDDGDGADVSRVMHAHPTLRPREAISRRDVRARTPSPEPRSRSNSDRGRASREHISPARAAALHTSSPGRHLSYRDGQVVISVQTQAGPGMAGVSNADLHCAHHDRKPQVPTAAARRAALPQWYARRAEELRTGVLLAPSGDGGSRRSSISSARGSRAAPSGASSRPHSRASAAAPSSRHSSPHSGDMDSHMRQ